MKNCKIERKTYKMDKNQIIETAFEAIKESTEWGIGEEGRVYGHFVGGIVAVVDCLLDKINEEKNRKPDENKKRRINTYGINKETRKTVKR